VSYSSEVSTIVDRPPGQKIERGEIFLLCCSVISLLASCILWSPHKQIWMDEIFTWKEVSDRSLWHLYYAIQHGADGGQPLFYTTAWLWAKAFGTGVLTLRLYSSLAIGAALLVTWITMRRFYGLWATAFGVLAFWGTSDVLLDQNVEGRFYGLYLLTVAITANLYARLVTRPSPSRLLLVLVFLSQAALVWTHVLGVICSALILLALIVADSAKGRLRLRLYLAYTAGWLALLVWIPAIRSSMAAGKPHGWIAMPTLTDLRTSYLYADCLQWLRLCNRHSFRMGFLIVSRGVEFFIYVPLAVVFLLCLRRAIRSGWRTVSEPRGALLLLAYSLLSLQPVLFVLSHLITPVFAPRYMLPSGIGLAIVLTASASALGADAQIRSRWTPHWMWVAIILLLVAAPVLTALAVGPIRLNLAYLDVEGVERMAPAGVPVVAAWQEDFSKFMRLSPSPQARYYYPLDWSAALAGRRSFVLDYHLMQAYRNSGYYSRNIWDSNTFLCYFADFLVLDAPNAETLDSGKYDSANFKEPNWFDLNIRAKPEFDWKVLGSFDAPAATRRLIAVHRKAPLAFCH
jgi:hypothetical protein